MTRHNDTLIEANRECMDEFSAAIDSMVDQQMQEQDRQERPWWYYQDQDKVWIHKVTSNGYLTMNKRKI